MLLWFFYPISLHFPTTRGEAFFRDPAYRCSRLRMVNKVSAYHPLITPGRLKQENVRLVRLRARSDLFPLDVLRNAQCHSNQRSRQCTSIRERNPHLDHLIISFAIFYCIGSIYLNLYLEFKYSAELFDLKPRGTDPPPQSLCGSEEKTNPISKRKDGTSEAAQRRQESK